MICALSFVFSLVISFCFWKLCIKLMGKPGRDKQAKNQGAWSKQEDQKLIDYIRKHGEGCWSYLPQAAGLLRCGKSCRLRWINYLRPDLKRGNFAEDEEDLIIKLHALLGNRWSLIAGRLPGRTDNEVKNYWNSHLRRKLINIGVDPNNHRLKRNLLRPHNPPNPASASSSGLQIQAIQRPTKPRVDKEQVSDALSCVEDDPCALPDLNLDLTASFHYPSIPHAEGNPKDSSPLDIAPSPTLLLFQ